MDQNKKLRIGWFTFTCCEDSTIMFIELLNTHREWLTKIDFIHANVLKSKNRWENMDVAFVEGAICSPNQEEKLIKIRSYSKKLITIGACACTGMPSSQRNNFDEKTREEIRELLEKFRLPDNMLARLEGRSSLGRLGIVVHSTASIFDPGWDGVAVLELGNLGRMPVALYPGMRICALTFEQLTSAAEVPYTKKSTAKYVGQDSPVASRINQEK